MTESDLDSLYGELCRSLSEVGEAGAPLFLARFALLAIGDIDDVGRVRALLLSARDCEWVPAIGPRQPSLLTAWHASAPRETTDPCRFPARCP
jgi:hypothetical protein